MDAVTLFTRAAETASIMDTACCGGRWGAALRAELAEAAAGG